MARMRSRYSFFLVLLALAAGPALAVSWHAMKVDSRVGAILSIDKDSIKTEGADTRFRYMVDFRTPQGDDTPGTTKYRSIVVNATVRCKARTISLGRTAAYGALGGEGVTVARNNPTKAEMEFKPLQKGSSDEDLFKYVCQPAKK